VVSRPNSSAATLLQPGDGNTLNQSEQVPALSLEERGCPCSGHRMRKSQRYLGN